MVGQVVGGCKLAVTKYDRRLWATSYPESEKMKLWVAFKGLGIIKRAKKCAAA